MKVNIITGDGEHHSFDLVNSAFYSEDTDEFVVVAGKVVFRSPMGEISELEIYDNEL